jgi:ribosomal-protein-alanine N-acetyltransferase
MTQMRPLDADGLRLEPLVAADADAMFALLSDRDLYRYIDEAPPDDVDKLRARYARLESRASADGRQAWLNWIVRTQPGGAPLGFVQATVLGDGSAWVAYLLGRAHQGRGVE